MRVSHISTAAATAFLYRNKNGKIVVRERKKYLTAIINGFWFHFAVIERGYY